MRGFPNTDPTNTGKLHVIGETPYCRRIFQIRSRSVDRGVIPPDEV